MNKPDKMMLKHIEQIKACYNAVIKSKSPYLKNDIEKKIYSLKKELKEYCAYKNISYKTIVRVYNI